MRYPAPLPSICYSGYRPGQNPNDNSFPTYEQVKEDLLLLSRHWKQIRLYDSGRHAEVVLEVIEKENLDTTVMLGAGIRAEVNNPHCPWSKTHSPEELAANQIENAIEIQRLIALANRYPTIVRSLSAGNEATVDWTDHLVPVEKVIAYVKAIQSETKQPVTFCENYVPWRDKLEDLAKVVNFISLHTYPVWEYKTVEQALEYTQANYYSVANRYPHKKVVISEAGWTTRSNDKGIPAQNVGEDQQKAYCQALVDWCEKERIQVFLFEAFDEEWKGSYDPLEPEKHWGLFSIDRSPKKVATLFDY